MTNCPNCGVTADDDQQFCRDCGEALTASARRQRIPRAFWAMSLAFAGLMVALTGAMINVRPVIFAGVFMSVMGMFGIAAMSILYQGRRRRPRVAPRIQLSKADTTNKLPPIPAAEHFTSVTENTTNLLDQPSPSNSSQRN